MPLLVNLSSSILDLGISLNSMNIILLSLALVRIHKKINDIGMVYRLLARNGIPDAPE